MANILDYNKMLSKGTATPANVQKVFPGATYTTSAPKSSNNSGGGGNAGGGNSGGGDNGGISLPSIVNDFQAQLDAYNSKVSDYQKQNPFNFDDMQAKGLSQATAALNPYYSELLDNYMQGINYTRQRSLEDENRAVTNLQADIDAYTGQAKANLQNTLLQAGQQYSDSGSYDSGARARTQGIDSVNSAYDIGNQQRQAAYNIQTQHLAGQRLRNQDIPLQISNENLQVGQQYSTDLKNLASQDTQNLVNAYKYTEGTKLGAPPGSNSLDYSNNLSTLLPYVNQNIPTTLPSNLQLPGGQ
jgi:hypothetical protein